MNECQTSRVRFWASEPGLLIGVCRARGKEVEGRWTGNSCGGLGVRKTLGWKRGRGFFFDQEEDV